MKRIFIDADKCDGCMNCTLACMNAHRKDGEENIYTLDLGLTTLSLGPTAAKEGDEVLTAESRSGYAKAIIRDGKLVHITIQGDIGNTGFWQEIVKRGINPRTPGKSLAELSYADFWKYDEASGKYAWD